MENDAIKKTGGLYGFDERGNPNKPISLFLLGGHGTRISTNLGKPSIKTETAEDINREKLYLDISDENELKTLAKYFGKDCQVVYVSCFAGQGKEIKNNMVNMTRRALPHIWRVYANTSNNPISHFVFDEKDMLANVVWAHWDEGYHFDLRLNKALTKLN